MLNPHFLIVILQKSLIWLLSYPERTMKLKHINKWERANIKEHDSGQESVLDELIYSFKPSLLAWVMAIDL